ncbi:LysR family transcriptional regulator [Variovorax sp. OV329]|uniref:LysR family transcriptional regulator n=1 Tax=Variovorax sp. OV329 TaxID=1882825 RepID=UPI0008E0E7E9|nr:LysR family transcriptional regulator [Variovorax sp. OV329]SFM34125.1 DNA-binding transcriptional regulator, LysR family [Variovorax sp. OV329]
MTLVQIRHLISLATTGSFSASAQAMHLTQPALSRSIRALEDELGVPLFDRIGRRNELTPFGRQVLERARQLALDADELHDSARLMGQAEGGELRVGMGSGPGAMLMTPLLMRMAERHARVKVVVARGQTDLLLQALRARTLDALVVDALSLKPAPDLKMDTVREMRGVFMCRPGHPLARKRSGVRFADVQRYPIASTPLSDQVAGALVEAYGPQAHPDACVTLQCEELQSLVDVARRSDAVLLAIRAAAPELVELDMRPALKRVARFALVTLARRTEAPSLRILRALMDEQLRD